MSSSQPTNFLEEDAQPERLGRRFVQTAAKPISDDVEMHDELDDISPGSSSTSKPGLNSLADVGPNERPPYSNYTLVKNAILGSPAQKLTLAEIYTAIMDRFPWYKKAGNGWKNSVRHCLSLDTQFYKGERSTGKGCYWKVSVDTPRGNKRERKRNRKPSRRSLVKNFQHGRSQPPTSFPLTTPAFRDATTHRAPDYDTTVPVTSTALFCPQPISESGWTPYFPSKATNSVPIPVPAQHFAEVTYPEGAAPSTSNAPSVPASDISLSALIQELRSAASASAVRVSSARVPSKPSASLAPNTTLARAPSASSAPRAARGPIARGPSASSASRAARASKGRVPLARALSASSAPRAARVSRRRVPIARAPSASSASPAARVPLASASGAPSAPRGRLEKVPLIPAPSSSPAPNVPPARPPLTLAPSASSTARGRPESVHLISASNASSAPSAPSVPQSALSVPRAPPASVNSFKLSSVCHWDELEMYSDEFESEEEQ